MKAKYIVCLLAVFIINGNLFAQAEKQQLREAESLREQGAQLYQQGKYNEALPIWKRSLAIYEKKLGLDHPETAIVLNCLAALYGTLGDNEKAQPFYERALAIREKSLGANHPATLFSINNLAGFCKKVGDSKNALTLYLRALSINEKVSGLHHPDTAGSLNNLAGVYSIMGNYAKAQPLYERSFAILKKALGPEHPKTVASLNNLAFVYLDMGDYAKSLPLFEQSITIREKALGPEHPDMATSLNNLAGVYSKMINYAKALPLFERSLAIWEKALGPEHPKTSLSIHNLARNYTDMGDYAKALPLYERLLTIREKALGPEHPDTADSLNSLAHVYHGVGDYAKALPLYERSLAIREKAPGPEHPDTADSVNNLAGVYLDVGDYAKALPLFERSLAIREKALGPEHPNTADSLNNLAGVYRRMGNYAKALPLRERSLVIREKALGLEHPDTAASLNNLAFYYLDMGDYAKALPLFERSLAIWEKALGPEHPDTATSFNNLALLNYRMDNILSAQNYASRLTASKQKELQSILILDERTRLSWQKKNQGWNLWLPCVLDSEQLAELILTNKGIVLESLAEDRALAQAAGLSGDGAKILQSIKSLQLQLSKMAFEKGKEKQSQKLQDEIGRLQRELTTKYLGRDRQRISASITMADIVPALSGGGVLVDFIEFQDPKLKGEESTCLGAIITAEDNSPIFVRIDGGKSINRSIENLRSAINQGNAAEVEAQTKFLSEKLWQPVAAKIPEGAKRLFICPDANLNFLSFAALLEPDGRFVAEKYPISYIGSARDLAKKPSDKISKSMAIFANPQFDASGKNSKTTEMVAMRSAEADVFGSIALPPLPGTEVEAQSLGSLATESGWNVKSSIGKDATELSVRNTKKPGVLHLATHGFYLNSFTPPAPEGSRGMSVVGVKESAEEKKKNEKGVDPMRASGVALTGAQNTLTSWSQRKAPDPETDGVLTAEEVGALRLDGTWMVVLSACETGVGEARSGEGVFGLRRAFMIAGAENLLMTLWPVADETTAKIMADFYKEAFATGDAAGSLAKVQRDWLVKLRQERGLLAAIREAGPFAMVVMTAPSVKSFTQAEVSIPESKTPVNSSTSSPDPESEAYFKRFSLTPIRKTPNKAVP
jgi:tetratricopeptide (TPR) repeat protein